MTANNYTPGPWHTIPKPSRLCKGLIPVGVAGETLLLAETRHGNGEANALLAAAAPELLEALRESARELQRIADNQLTLCDESLTDVARVDWTVLHVALAAIAKAEGQEVSADA